MQRNTIDTIVVGGGLAGLTAATIVARAGRSVTVVEKSIHPGGRARTDQEKGFQMNLGPHALYKGGEGFRLLKRMGIRFTGKSPEASSTYLYRDGELNSLRYSFLNADLLLFYKNISRIDTEALQHVPIAFWLERNVRSKKAREIIAMLIRIATYSDAPDHLAAGAALEQLRYAIQSGVLYLDGGWQSLVDGLTNTANSAGVQMINGSRAVSLQHGIDGQTLLLANGESIQAKNMILAVSPKEASALMPDAGIAIPESVEMASLTLGMKKLPIAKRKIVFGVKEPFYFSTHSEWASLTSDRQTFLVHAAKYLAPGAEHNAQTDLQQIEQFLDRIQPGWRNEVLASRFLQAITVSNASVTASGGGLKGRMNIKIQHLPGIYLCGDWIGDRGMLADASFASAELAAEYALQDFTSSQAVA